MREKFDIVVVGGGISGCALFYELSRSGMGKVALLEAGEIASKITGDSGGYIRKFNTDPYLAQLASESFDYYQNFESEVGGACDFRKTGLVSRVTSDAFEGLKTQIEQLRSSGHEIFASNTAPTESLKNARYGDDAHMFIYEPTLGNINTKLACRSWVNAAVKNGGSVFENTKLNEITLRSTGSVAGLQSTRGVIESDVVVMSAGAWSKDLLSSLPIDVSSISARSFQYNIYPGAAQYLGTAFMDNIEGFYTAPFRDGSVFAGTLGQDRLVQNAAFDHGDDEDAAEHLHSMMKKHFSWAESVTRLKMRRSYDAYTDDGRGIVKSFPEIPGLILASGWSSGGIKSAPAVARLTTKLLAKRESLIGGTHANS